MNVWFKKCNLAFTLMEIMVVVVIIGLIAGFSIPTYNTVVEKAHRKSAEENLRILYEANKLYKAKNNEYWPQANGNSIAAINGNLGTYITEEGMTYNCDGDGTTYSCTATRAGGSFVITLSLGALSAINIACAGMCP